MAAFLALLLVRAAKLTHPLGKLLCLPAALLLVIRFVPGVLYQLSLFPLAAPLPFITGNLYSVIDALLLRSVRLRPPPIYLPGTAGNQVSTARGRLRARSCFPR